MSTLTILADRSGIRTVVRGILAAGKLVVLTGNAFSDLQEEMGSDEKAGEWLLAQVTAHGVPIGLNVPEPDGRSTTVFMAPPGWSQARLQGWVGTAGGELEAAFGSVTSFMEPP